MAENQSITGDQNENQDAQGANNESGKAAMKDTKNPGGKNKRTASSNRRSAATVKVDENAETATPTVNLIGREGSVLAAYNSYAVALGKVRKMSTVAAIRDAIPVFGVSAGNNILNGVTYEQSLTNVNKDTLTDPDDVAEVPSIQVTPLQGDQTLKAILTRLYSRFQGQSVHLPFTSGALIDSSSYTIIQNYMAMIALRKKAIPEGSWDNLPMLAQIGITLNPDDISSLDESYEMAKARYLSTNVIQPLLRYSLLDRGSSHDLNISDIRQKCLTYSQWLKALDIDSLKPSLQASVLAHILQWEELEGFINVRSVMLGGVPQVANIGIPMLLKAVKNKRTSTRDFSVTGDMKFTQNPFKDTQIDAMLGDDQLIMHNPYGTSTRRVVLRDYSGEAAVTEEAFDAYVPTINNDDVIALLLELAKLKGVDFSDKIDLAFASRFPKWSGLLVNSQTDLSEDIAKHLESITYYQTLIDILNGKSGDQKLMAIFDESNRADLQASSADKISILALFYSNYVKAITNILSAVVYSKEYKHEEALKDIIKFLNVDITAAADLATNETTVIKVRQHPNDIYLSNKMAFISRRVYVHKDLNFLPSSITPFFRKMRQARLVGSFSYLDSRAVRLPSGRKTLLSLAQYKSLSDIERFLMGKPDFFVDNRDELSRSLGDLVSQLTDEDWDVFRVTTSDDVDDFLSREEGLENYLIIVTDPVQFENVGLEQADIIRYNTKAADLTGQDIEKYGNLIVGGKRIVDNYVFEEGNDLIESFDVTTWNTNHELLLMAKKSDLDVSKYVKVWTGVDKPVDE